MNKTCSYVFSNGDQYYLKTRPKIDKIKKKKIFAVSLFVKMKYENIITFLHIF